MLLQPNVLPSERMVLIFAYVHVLLNVSLYKYYVKDDDIFMCELKQRLIYTDVNALFFTNLKKNLIYLAQTYICFTYN